MSNFKLIFIILLMGWTVVFSLTKVQNVSGIQNTKWYTYYEQGIRNVESKAYDAAIEQFNKVLSIEKVAEGYFGLGLVFSQTDSTGEKAIDAFNKAINKNDQFARAYYQLALIYDKFNKDSKAQKHFERTVKIDDTFIDAWYRIGIIQKKEDKINKYLETFTEVIKRDPSFKNVYNEFVQDVIYLNKEDKLIDVLKSLKGDSTQPHYVYDLASSYFRTADYTACMNALDRLQTEHPMFSASSRHLIRAKVLINTDEPEQAMNHYWMAVDSMKDERDVEEIFNDLRYIMQDSEYVVYQKNSIKEQAAFFRGFWNKRDPNHSTPLNERIVEHYKRMAFALEHYRKSGARIEWHKAAHEYQHPFRRYYGYWVTQSGEELYEKVGLPKSIPKQRIFDDLGLIYIRHGEPDKQISAANPEYDIADIPPLFLNLLIKSGHGDENLSQWFERDYGFDTLPMNLSWKYLPRRGRPEMVFHFVKFSGQAGWVIEAFPTVIYDREMLDNRYLRMRQAVTTARLAEVAEKYDWVNDSDPLSYMVSEWAVDYRSRIQTNMEELTEDNLEHIELGLQTETSRHTFKEKPLDFRYEFASFKDRDGKNLIELYYAVEGARTGLSGVGRKSHLQLEQYIGFYDPTGKEIVRLEKENNRPVGMTKDEWERRGLLGVEKVELEPGQYEYEFHIKDEITGKLGAYRGKFSNEDYWKQDLNISDILLISDIRPKNENEVFVKKDIAFTPRMFSDFKQGEKIGVYFEVYDLTFNADMKTRFEVTYTVRPHSPKKQSLPSKMLNTVKSLFTNQDEQVVESTYEHRGDQDIEKIYTSFDLDTYEPGDYELVVKIKDQNVFETRDKKVLFTIK